MPKRNQMGRWKEVLNGRLLLLVLMTENWWIIKANGNESIDTGNSSYNGEKRKLVKWRPWKTRGEENTGHKWTQLVHLSGGRMEWGRHTAGPVYSNWYSRWSRDERFSSHNLYFGKYQVRSATEGGGQGGRAGRFGKHHTVLNKSISTQTKWVNPGKPGWNLSWQTSENCRPHAEHVKCYVTRIQYLT